MKKNNSGIAAIKSGGSGGARQFVTSSGAVVLHVDDDPNDTALLEAARCKAGVQFRLENVCDGEQAMAYLNGGAPYQNRISHPFPTLVLLDLKMPRATGFEILKWIRNHVNCKNLPVVVLSGSELHEDIQQACSMGANSYLVKPLGFEALVKLVKQIAAIWLVPRPPRISSVALDEREGRDYYLMSGHTPKN
jgi:CheY-like chemotaxis protein